MSHNKILKKKIQADESRNQHILLVACKPWVRFLYESILFLGEILYLHPYIHMISLMKGGKKSVSKQSMSLVYWKVAWISNVALLFMAAVLFSLNECFTLVLADNVVFDTVTALEDCQRGEHSTNGLQHTGLGSQTVLHSLWFEKFKPALEYLLQQVHTESVNDALGMHVTRWPQKQKSAVYKNRYTVITGFHHCVCE